MQSTPGKDAMKTIKMTTKNLECYAELVDKQWQDLRTDSDFERSSTKGEMLLNSTACYKETVKARVNLGGKLHCCLSLKSCHRCSNLQQPIP